MTGESLRGAHGLLIEGLEDQRRLVALARVQVFAAHVGQSDIAFFARRVPMLAAPTGPSRRAKVSLERIVIRIPYGFGASSGLVRLWAWQMSMGEKQGPRAQGILTEPRRGSATLNRGARRARCARANAAQCA